jgi:PAS domain S-box-containing protein
MTPAALDALGQMVAMARVDDEGHVSWVSDRWCSLTGWGSEEIVGSHWKAVVHPDDLALSLEVGRRVVRDRRPLRFESRIVSRTGSVTWIESQVWPLASASDTQDWLLVAVDITPYQEATEALRRSERRLQVIFDNSTDVITIVDANGTWRTTSLGGSQLLGDQAVRSHPSQATRPRILEEDRPVMTAAFRELLSSGQRYGRPFLSRVQTVDGRIRWLESTTVNLTDDPAVGGIVFHSRDVTEGHQAADALHTTANQLATLVENLTVGIILCDENLEVVHANRTVTELFGLGQRPSEMVGRDRDQLMADLSRLYRDHRVALARIVAILNAREPVHDERVTLADGRPLARSFIPIQDDAGRNRGHLWLFRDLTAEAAMAEERDRVLAMEREQNVRLTELDALKTDLVASVSHELRTPLTSIVSFTHLLRDGLGADSQEDQHEFLDIIERNTKRLLRLVDDLLLLDRLESNSLQVSVEPVDVLSLIEGSLASLGPVAEAKGLTLHQDLTDGPRLPGDVGRLGQLLDNLLANAVKFTAAGGQFTVVARPEGDGWRLEVHDTGIGIPADEVGQLFQRFYRASNARRDAAPGSGLGLVIALRIAELHGGTVSVESEVGVGTTVTVTLVGAPVRRGASA